MLVRTIQVKLDENDTLKVSIFRNAINNRQVYHAKYVNINLDIYKDLTIHEQSTYYGIDYKESSNGPIVYYSDIEEFLRDLPSALISGPRLSSKVIE